MGPTRWCSKQNLIYLGIVSWLMLLGSTIYLFQKLAHEHRHNETTNIRPPLPPRFKGQPVDTEQPIDTIQPVVQPVDTDKLLNISHAKNEDLNITQVAQGRGKIVLTDDDPDYKRIIDKDQAVLIVGGTDGSGTRKVAQVLEYLGANMVVDDMGTYDIHAEIVKGWPKIVTPVIDITKSLNYDIYKDVPDDVRYNTTSKLQILLTETENKVPKKSLPIPKNMIAEKIYYGFKAPISMALLPFWVNIIPKIKFIHIVRDGRDIAFSDNTGPIRKFFNCTYGPNSKYEKDRNEVKAIRLWNDQNLQVHKFIESFRKQNGNESTFDYFTIRTEDLLTPNHDVRFNTVKQLAQFIGSNASDSDICCLATQGNLPLRRKEMRIVGRSGLKAESRLKYGKWKAKLKENKQLQSTFAIASEALEVFGYEPELVHKDADSHKCAGVTCKKTLPIPARTTPSRPARTSSSSSKGHVIKKK